MRVYEEDIKERLKAHTKEEREIIDGGKIKRYGCAPLALRKNMSKNADFDNQYCHITTITSHNT